MTEDDLRNSHITNMSVSGLGAEKQNTPDIGFSVGKSFAVRVSQNHAAASYRRA